MPNSFTISWEVMGETQLRRRLVGMSTRTLDARPAFEQIIDVVQDEAKHQFADEGDPPWPEYVMQEGRSSPYLQRKLRPPPKGAGHGTLMVWSGGLALSLTQRWAHGAIVETGPDFARRGTSLTVGKRRRWNLGAIHQGGWGSVPKRAMLLLRPIAQNRIVRILRDWIFQRGEGSSTYSK